MLLVSGKPSTGKSVLSEWVVERLQASTGRRASEVITYTVGMFSTILTRADARYMY